MPRFLPHFALLALLGGHSPAETSKPLPAFLDQHCVECHDADVKKGGLDLASLKFDPSKSAWIKVFERVRDGEMPPKKKPQPEKAEKDLFLAALKEPLLEADAADIAANGRVRSRRLTRTSMSTRCMICWASTFR
jgi:mono/diheme cytochrome c family protein